MNESISSGGTRFAAAKKALKQVAGALPAGAQVGLRVYGSKIAAPKSQNPKACTDTDLVRPIGPLDKSTMYRAVDSFKALGETPISYSLGKAVDDLGQDGKRVVVLISDGEETCAKDPCATARKLAGAGVDLQFNAIGLDVNRKARQQLRCIAEVGDGSYYDASRAGDLTEAVRKITQRALRPFQVSGTRVKGTEDPADAPPLTPGQYVDRYNASTTARYYTITRTPGSTVTVSIASIVRPRGAGTSESWSLKLTTTAGDTCGFDDASANTSFTPTVLAGAVSAGTGFKAVTSDPPPACSSDPALRLSLSRQPNSTTKKTVPVEIVVGEEPPVTNLSSLPEPVTKHTGKGKRVAPVKPTKKVVGGSAFSNAADVSAGSWEDSLALGETVFYRVRVEAGQSARATLVAPAPGTSSGLRGADVVSPRLSLYTPSRTRLTTQYTNLSGRKTVRITAVGPEVRVRNREVGSLQSGVAQASSGGYYYFAASLDQVQADLTGRVVQVRLDVAVTGQPGGQPQYVDAASASPTPSPTATPDGPSESVSTALRAPPASSAPVDSGGSPVLPIAVVGLAAVAAIGLAVALLRRSRRTNRADTGC